MLLLDSRHKGALPFFPLAALATLLNGQRNFIKDRSGNGIAYPIAPTSSTASRSSITRINPSYPPHHPILFSSAVGTNNHLHPYAWIYFVGEPVTIILGLAVVYEVLWHLIRSYEMLRMIGGRLFWMSLAIAALTGLMMLKTSPFGGTSVWNSVVLLERSARFVQVGVLIAFILFISRLGLTWKHYTSGIVAGFGVAAGLQLALFELRSLHAIGDVSFVLLNSAAYNCAVLIWAAYFIPRRVHVVVPTELPKTDLARWDELLRKYLSR